MTLQSFPNPAEESTRDKRSVLPSSVFPSVPAQQPAPAVKTPLPGPASQAYLERQQTHESGAVSYPRRLPIAIRRASGSYIEDMDGNLFIDFLTGAGVLPLGHNHPELVAAARLQLDSFCHGLDFPTPVKDQFREAHLAKVPASMGKTRMHFCGPTGADAVEAAIKLARLHTRRHNIIGFHGSYHGCTSGALALTGDLQVKSRLGVLTNGIHFFPFRQARNTGQQSLNSGYDFDCTSYLREALTDPNAGIALPAAIILELVQGEGGVYPADENFVRALRELTEELDICLIIDEVQTGCGRTGQWFAFEHYGISPDIICLSKALSGLGMPAACLIFKEELNSWGPGDHIGTFRGNQLAFAAGARMVQVMDDENTLANVREISGQLMADLLYMAADHDFIANVRGKGLMLGLEIMDPDTGKRDGTLARHIQQTALQKGLILEVGGRDGAVLRMLPPLNLTVQTLMQASEILSNSLTEARAEARKTPPSDSPSGETRKSS